jgi:hypothetical protein
MMDMNSGSAMSVTPDHTAVFLAPFVVPIVIWVFLLVVNCLDQFGVPLATRFVVGYRHSSPLARVIAVLLLLAGVSHLLLVPAHLVGDPTLALLFELNGLAFVLVAAGVFVWARWRLVAGLLTLATLIAYLGYLIAGRETLDEVGILCYLLELVILALVWIPDYNGAAARQTDPARSGQEERAIG